MRNGDRSEEGGRSIFVQRPAAHTKNEYSAAKPAVGYKPGTCYVMLPKVVGSYTSKCVCIGWVCFSKTGNLGISGQLTRRSSTLHLSMCFKVLQSTLEL